MTCDAADHIRPDPARDAGLTGVLLVVGEAGPLFCVGLAIGRTDLDAPAARRPLRLAGAAPAALGLLVLAVRGGLDLTDVDGPVELAASTTSTRGWACWCWPAACTWGAPGFAVLWPRRHRSGPVEAAVRPVSGG